MSVKQLILDLIARDKTGTATKGAADNLKTVGDAAADAAKDTERLGKESDKAEDEVGKLGKSARTAAQHVEHLDREIESTERELRQLAVAFAEAGTAAERIDLSKAIRRTEVDLRRLNKSKGLLSGLIPEKIEPGVGQKIGRSLGKDIGDGLSSAKVPLAAAFGAALAPTVGAVIAAAVIGAAGAGGLLGGVIAVSKDPAIAGSAKAIGKSWVDGVNTEARQAFLEPVKKSLGQVNAFAASSVGKIGKIFDATGPQLEGFTAKVLHAGDAILDGLVDSAGKSAPVMSEFGNIISDTGDSVGELLTKISDHSDEAASGLRDVNSALQDTIGAVGDVVVALLLLKGGIDKIDELAHKSENLGKTFDTLTAFMKGPLALFGLFKDGLDGSSDSTEDLAGEQGKLPAPVGEATKAVRDQVDALTDLSNRLKAETDPIFGLLNAQDDLRDSQKGVNEAIKEHGKNSPEYEAALRKQAEAALGLEAAAGKVATTSSGKLGPALRATLEQAGFTKAEIANLERQFKTAKGAGDAFAKTYQARIVADTSGAIASMKRAKSLYDQFRSKKISVDVYVSQHVSNKVQRQLGDAAFRAEGGPVRAGNAYVVGEKRPEVFVPDQNGRIIPSVSQYASAGMPTRSGSAPSGGDGGWVAIRGDAVIDALVSAIASRVGAKGSRAAQLGIRFI